MPYDSRYPPEHTTYNTTAPLHSITAEDYVPDQQATKRKRAQRIKDLILFVVIAVFLGSILYVSLIATKTNDNDKSRFASTAQPVNAQITKVNTYINTGRADSYYAILTYTLNGQEYTSAEVPLTKKAEEGTYIRVYVSPNDPTHPQSSIPSVQNVNDTIPTIFWGFIIITGAIFLFLLIRLIWFLKNPYHKRYYKKDAMRTVYKREFEINRQQYETAHALPLTSPAPVNSTFANSTVVVPTGSPSAPKEKKPLTYKQGLMFFIIGIGITLVGAIPILITLLNYIPLAQFQEKAIPIQTTIVSVRTQRHTSTGKHKSTSTLYYATVEYTYGDTTYRRGEYQVSNTNRIGTTYTLYIDPNNPGDCRPAPHKGNLIWNSIGSIIPIVMGLFFGIGGLNYMIKAKKREREGLSP